MLDRTSLAIAGLGVAAYAWVALDGLSLVPPVSDDEVWIASTAHKLAAQGVLGSDLMTGFFGGERHTYHHMPFYPLVLAGVFRALGTSAVTMRLLPAVCGLLVLLMVLALGRRLGGPNLGSLAMTSMLLLRVSTGGSRTGIPLFDVARTSRYDIMVPVFGLAALLLFPPSGRGRPARWLAVGALVGLSALTHVYGAFLLAGLIAVRFGGRPRMLRSKIGLVLAGFLLAVSPWLLFVARGWADFKGQLAVPGGRFEVLDPWFYGRNVFHEAERFRAVTGPLAGAWQRPGVLAVVVGLPVALLLALRRLRRGEADAIREIALLFAVQAFLFAALLQSKLPSYAIALWPLVVLLVASVMVRLWSDGPRPWARVSVAAFLLWAAADGVWGVGQRHAAEAGVTAYDAFEARLREVVPRRARVLGLPRFWLGLQETDYRTWAVPFSVVRSPGSRVTLRQALEDVDPEIVLVDGDMAAALVERASPDHPYHSEAVDTDAFFEARKAVLVTVLQDPTYGPVKVYRLRRSWERTASATPSPRG
jgi:4-amino-4-deoxy-L-arabinose transferase-like glycosyltransferase